MNELSVIDIERELRRIGVDGRALGGLVISGHGLSRADILAWLRLLPTGLGRAAFLERLKAVGPTPGLAVTGVPPRDPTFHTPDLDVLQAFLNEMHRVLPPDPKRGWTIIDPIDYAAATARLKTLPDQAGWDAVGALVPLASIREPDSGEGWLPPQSADVLVAAHGREHPWLSRVISAILAPFFKWRFNMRARRKRGDDGAA